MPAGQGALLNRTASLSSQIMFGNILGWAISGVILILTCVAMWFFYVAGAYLSPPGKVGQNAANYSMQLPLDPRSLASWMSEEGDAIAIYKGAIADYNAKTRHYNIYIERGKLNSAEYTEIEKGVNLLVSASTKKGPGVFKDRPGELITYDT